MRFWRYGMVRKDFSPSAIRRSMSRRHASEVVKKRPEQDNTWRFAGRFLASLTFGLVTIDVTNFVLDKRESYLNNKHPERKFKRLNPSFYPPTVVRGGDDARKKY